MLAYGEDIGWRDSFEEKEENLPEEEYALISRTDNNNLNFKFKLIELFSKN